MNRSRTHVRPARGSRLAPALAVVLALSAGAEAQENSLALTDAETIPGSSFSLLLEAQLNEPIRAFQVGIAFPRRAMELAGVTFAGTELEGRRFDIFEVDTSVSGEAILRVSLDELPPFRTDIAPGSAVVLARLEFRMKQGLTAGEEFTVELRDGLGIPPVPARVFTAADALPVGLGSGTVRILSENVLKIETVTDARPGFISTLEFTAFNLEPLQGFTIAMRFDPTVVRFLSLNVDGTITDAVGAEFIDPVIDNEKGELILGVLLDIMPPFENQLIPASGLALTIARADFVVLQREPGEERPSEVPLTLVDGLGKPPKKNIFVIDNNSVLPRKADGAIIFTEDVAFMRGDAAMDGKLNISDAIRVVNFALLQIQGVPCQKAADANDDGRVDLADVLFILLYLFDRGEILPPPFPEKGFDPTPDILTCESGD